MYILSLYLCFSLSLSIYIYIYIYIFITCMYNWLMSNPRELKVWRLEAPRGKCDVWKLPGAGPIFPDVSFENSWCAQFHKVSGNMFDLSQSHFIQMFCFLRRKETPTIVKLGVWLVRSLTTCIGRNLFHLKPLEQQHWEIKDTFQTEVIWENRTPVGRNRGWLGMQLWSRTTG